ncbi:MAG: DUF1707 domain-containing protein [Gemmatimonadales bacterium]|jgi:hypothetical protein|nr:DUF1707 domain-containing protein [Gemmatimonadales bacterium]MBT3960076.1 DUF1707 domain-containing protein [Gemmatimonadales bacterium]MBT4438531.1 DUF1707 domain-containing protein [Gemmatimonadales bacterium]
MTEDGGPKPVAHTRQVTIDALCEHFANDIMSVEEFEQRVDAAHSAKSVEDLKELLQDLPGGNLPSVPQQVAVPAPAPMVLAAAPVKDREFVVAVLGGSAKKGRWSPARKNIAVAVMGGAELDFRDAVMGPGITELQVHTMWGGVEVIVPPGLHVESHGIAILGAFEHAGDNIHTTDPHAPTLRITGIACMGGVHVTTRHSGETARDARRRRKLERKEQRRLSKGGRP